MLPLGTFQFLKYRENDQSIWSCDAESEAKAGFEGQVT
jgi:hypothetical protein